MIEKLRTMFSWPDQSPPYKNIFRTKVGAAFYTPPQWLYHIIC